MLDASIKRAYQDASSHVLSIPDESQKETVKQRASAKIKEAIERGLGEGTYDDWHQALCKELVNEYKNIPTAQNRSFTYGIAQKWVNMTMKYLCVIRTVFGLYGRSCEAEWEILVTHEKSLHVPFDSFILEAISDLEINLPKKDGTFGKFSAETKPWSKYGTYKEYKDLQDKLEGKWDESPLDWEGEAWIRVSERRKKSKAKA